MFGFRSELWTGKESDSFEADDEGANSGSPTANENAPFLATSRLPVGRNAPFPFISLIDLFILKGLFFLFIYFF